LHEAGRRLWTRITAQYELEIHELQLLEAAARQLDAVAALGDIVGREGLMVETPGGIKVHPAVAEGRMGRIAFAKLMGQISLPTEADERPMTAAQRQAQRAAQARWGRVAELRGDARGAPAS
jgi:hypothetical protein